MGDPRLLEPSQPVERFDTPELRALIADMQDTMAALNGAGLAAPQIGVPLQVVDLRRRVQSPLSRSRTGAAYGAGESRC